MLRRFFSNTSLVGKDFGKRKYKQKYRMRGLSKTRSSTSCTVDRISGVHVFITQTCGDHSIHRIAHHVVLKMVESPQELTDLKCGVTLSECYNTLYQIPVFVLGSD